MEQLSTQKAGSHRCYLGSFTVEMIVALAVLSATSLLVVVSFRQQLFCYRKLQHEEQQHKVRSVIARETRSAINKASSTHILTVRGQPPGKIVDAFGDQLARIGVDKISPDSTPLTVAAPDFKSQLYLQSLKSRELTAEISVCLTSSPSAELLGRLKGSSHWFGIALDGYTEFEGTLNIRSGSTDCVGKFYATGLLTARKQPMFLGTSIPENVTSLFEVPKLELLEGIAASLIAVVPISDSYTLYLDRKETLRRISHSTGEHQPIVRGVKKFLLASEGIQRSDSDTSMTIPALTWLTFELSDDTSGPGSSWSLPLPNLPTSTGNPWRTDTAGAEHLELIL